MTQGQDLALCLAEPLPMDPAFAKPSAEPFALQQICKWDLGEDLDAFLCPLAAF